MILCFGTLYPAYRSYKAVKTKDVREYVKWMMYWIVFAFFTAVENAADMFISWLPLYYEMKILFLIWLLSPATKGSSILYRRFVHPWLARHEKDIDKYIDNAKQNGYVALLRVGRQGLNVATDTFLKTAVTGQTTIINTLRKYSSMQELNRDFDETDAPLGPSHRFTWHEDTMPRNSDEYDFDDDYRVLEQQYKHDEQGAYTGEAQLPRNPSYQNTIPESLDESGEESDEVRRGGAQDDLPDEADEPIDTRVFAPSKRQIPPSGGKQEMTQANKRGNRETKRNEVSDMRGYSTLPRSRGQKVVPVAQTEYGGTLPRASRRRRSKLQRSNEM